MPISRIRELPTWGRRTNPLALEAPRVEVVGTGRRSGLHDRGTAAAELRAALGAGVCDGDEPGRTHDPAWHGRAHSRRRLYAYARRMKRHWPRPKWMAPSASRARQLMESARISCAYQTDVPTRIFNGQPNRQIGPYCPAPHRDACAQVRSLRTPRTIYGTS